VVAFVTGESASDIRMLDTEGFHEQARFRLPDGILTRQLWLSPSGDQLIASTGSLHFVGSLSAIRSELARRGLGWKAPPIKSAGHDTRKRILEIAVATATPRRHGPLS